MFEDLHWIDSETQALLDLVVDGIASVRILLLVNYRPEYHHQWGNRTYYTQLRLDPLGRAMADDMLTTLLGQAAELAPLRRLIIERTEGNPFFIEEMVQALFEQGVLVRNGAVKLTRTLDEIRVPPTVQAILASRIDRLAAGEKELLQTLAVLGREFPSGLIRRVTGQAHDELGRMLSELQLGEFIYEQPAIPDIEYIFKHALTQEVTYNSLLVERRRVLHECAGQAIEALYAERLEDHLPELAHHYDRSGNVPKAVEYLGRAGQRAARQSAYPESVAYLTRTLEVLKQLAHGVERDRQELDLQMALVQSLFVARGPGAIEREPVLTRARELCERLGDNTKLMEALLALASFRLVHRDFPAARDLARQALAMAEEAKSPSIVGGAHCQLGTILFMAGQPEAAREHCNQAVELFGAAPFHNSADFEYASRAAGIVAGASLMLGYPATALRKAGESLAAARRRSDPFQLAYTLFVSFMVHFPLRDRQTVGAHAEELFSLTSEYGIRAYLPHAIFYRAWAMATRERAEQGFAEMRQAVASTKVASSYAFPPMLTALAETCCNADTLRKDWSGSQRG
jgi:predicted ATPase